MYRLRIGPVKPLGNFSESPQPIFGPPSLRISSLLCYIVPHRSFVTTWIAEPYDQSRRMLGGKIMISRSIFRFLAVLTILLGAASLKAQQMPNPYGPPISLENAKKAAAAAVAEARKNNWTMVVAITDPGGDLVYLEKMDGTQTGSVRVATGKARTAALYKRPSKVFQD